MSSIQQIEQHIIIVFLGLSLFVGLPGIVIYPWEDTATVFFRAIFWGVINGPVVLYVLIAHPSPPSQAGRPHVSLPTSPGNLVMTTYSGDAVSISWAEMQAYKDLCHQHQLSSQVRRDFQSAWVYDPCLIHMALRLKPLDNQSGQDLLGE